MVNLYLAGLHLIAVGIAMYETYNDARWTNTGLKALPQEGEGSGFVTFFARTERPSFKQVFWIETLGHNLPLALLGLLLLSSKILASGRGLGSGRAVFSRLLSVTFKA